MILDFQRDKFSLEENVHYLNCAYMSPLLKSAEEAAISEIIKRRNPHHFSLTDFFDPVQEARKLFSSIIGNDDSERIAIIPSVSYGLANAANNLKYRPNGKVIGVEGQFPSNYYIWQSKCKEFNMDFQMIVRADLDWNEKILDAIDDNTAAVVIPQVHWADGTLFELKAIGEKCRKYGSLFVIDGTQSIGAFPFDIKEIKADAVICAGYKWLMGAYGLGLAYYGPYFDKGNAIEENWLPKVKSDEFAGLTEYQEEARPKAWKYNVGESSNFIYIKMLIASLSQLKEWNAHNIQTYTKAITEPGIEELRALDFEISEVGRRSSHLFGIKASEGLNMTKFDEELSKRKIFISKRGEYYRISPNVYNRVEDMDALVNAFRVSMR